MANYTFDVDEQGWAVDPSSSYIWTISDGSTALGCLRASDVSGSVSTTKSVSLSINDGDPFSFRVRVTSDGSDPGTITCGLHAGANFIEHEFTISSFPYDSGWILVSGTMSGPVGVSTLEFIANSIPESLFFQVSFDSIYVQESPPGGEDYCHSTGGIPGAVMI